MTAEIRAIVDRVLKVSPPTSGDLSRALGVVLNRTETAADIDSFAGTLPKGPFAAIELRINARTHLGILVLRARDGAPVTEKQVDRAPYGTATPSVNPHIPPEGTTTYSHQVGGIELSFQFTTKSRVLRLVSFKWPERT